jgi:hypothetical protein
MGIQRGGPCPYIEIIRYSKSNRFGISSTLPSRQTRGHVTFALTGHQWSTVIIGDWHPLSAYADPTSSISATAIDFDLSRPLLVVSSLPWPRIRRIWPEKLSPVEKANTVAPFFIHSRACTLDHLSSFPFPQLLWQSCSYQISLFLSPSHCCRPHPVSLTSVSE